MMRCDMCGFGVWLYEDDEERTLELIACLYNQAVETVTATQLWISGLI